MWRSLWGKIFFRIALPRTIGETILISAICWIGLTLLNVFVFNTPMRFEPMALDFYGWFGIIGVCWFAIRLRIPPKFGHASTWIDLCGAAFVCLILSTLQMPAIYTLLYTVDQQVHLEKEVFLWVPLVLFVINFVTCVTVRIVLRAILFWNYLRRKYLIWALTHAQLMLYVLGVIFFALLGLGLFLISSNGAAYRFVFILALTTFISIVVVLVIFLPPTALISYFAMNKTISRIRMLAAATSALRAGQYNVRVPIYGEDEVAQLQFNFNAMAEALEKAMRDLQGERDRVATLLNERRQLIANVSHELRTPVATVRGYLETTLMHRNEVSDQQLQHDLEIMESEVLHLQTRIEELFTLARADLGKLKIQLEPTDLGLIIHRIVDSRAPLAWRSSRIEILAVVADNIPKIMIDSSRVEQAIQNLLQNGIRHTAPGGIIIVSLLVREKTLALQIKDTGEGIPEADLPHIWERFYQANNHQSRAGGGTGLGLSLVREWVEAMGGFVEVESEVHIGTSFTLNFPLPVSQNREVSNYPTAPLQQIEQKAF